MGNRLKEALKGEEITAYQVSKDLGIDRGQLSRFLNGKSSLSLNLLERIAEYLGYDLLLVKRPSRKGGKGSGKHLQARKDLVD